MTSFLRLVQDGARKVVKNLLDVIFGDSVERICQMKPGSKKPMLPLGEMELNTFKFPDLARDAESIQ